MKLHGLIVRTDEAEASGNTELLFLWFVLGADDLKDSVESDHEASLYGLALH